MYGFDPFFDTQIRHTDMNGGYRTQIREDGDHQMSEQTDKIAIVTGPNTGLDSRRA